MGYLENIQVALAVLAMAIGGRMLTRRQPWPGLWLRMWVVLIVLGCLYIAGEELSWGQHLLHWRTPGWMEQVNDQGETNIHNISSWFDQKPRFLLELGILVGGVLRPLWVAWRAQGQRVRPMTRATWLWPTFVCVPTGILAEMSRWPDRIAEWVGHDIQFVSLRHSEVQEYFIGLFIIIYLLSLKVRLGAVTPISGAQRG